MSSNLDWEHLSQTDIINTKKHLEIDQEKLKSSYDRLERSLDEELAKLSSKVIPEISFHQLAKNNGIFGDDIEAAVKKHGVLIIRNVFNLDYAIRLYNDLSQYLMQNGENPSQHGSTWYSVYWSKEQIEARHHPNMVLVQKALLNLWKISSLYDAAVDLTKPLTYNDRFRFRKPNDDTFKLDPHMDAGSLSRWSDPAYKNVYKHIFEGNWEKHDPFYVNGRASALMEGCSFFRTFQGWTSLTESGPGDGTLTVLPLLKEPLAHILMRSLLDDIPDYQMLGHKVGRSQLLDPVLHEKLANSMVTLPKVYPGDTVWWHCDIIHSVEPIHRGKDTNAVLYIPVGPDCPINRLYVERAKMCFLTGSSPPDFHLDPKANIETRFKGRTTLPDLSETARIMMGF